MASSVVVLKMDVHCIRCARRIRKAIKGGVYGAGVQEVWASPETGHVVVTGPYLDASALRWRLHSMTGRRVDVVSDAAPEEAPPDNGRMVHLGPPQTGYGPYTGYYYGGGGGWVPAAPQYIYGYGYGARQYVPNEAPVCFNDDNPNGCCVMQ